MLLASGLSVPIDQVQVGDMVMASDAETGQQAAKPVEEVFVHEDTLVDLIVDGETIVTTEDHPFWSVTDARCADELASGELVLAADGTVVATEGIQGGSERTGLAYNLEVDGIHTYHVGVGQVLVHNKCGEPWLDPADTHVAQTHQSGMGNKSQFDPDLDLNDLLDDVADVAAVTRDDGFCQRICSLPYEVGTDLSGQPTNLLTVVSLPSGRVVTMHPGLPRGW